jgi:hypothetical protein
MARGKAGSAGLSLKRREVEAVLHCAAGAATSASSPAAEVRQTVKERPYMRAVAMSLFRGAIAKLFQVTIVSVCSWTQR